MKHWTVQCYAGELNSPGCSYLNTMFPGLASMTYVCAIYCTCCATCYLEAFSEILLDTVKTKSSTAAMDVLQSCKWYWNVLEQVSHIEDAIRGSSTRSLTRTK